MRAVIGVANVARGVGKTVTAVSLAAELALRGFETLLVDADPQAEATARLVGPDGIRLSLADLLFALDTRPHERTEGPRFGLEDVLVPVAPRTQGVQGMRYLVENLGNVPSGHGRVELLGVVCNLFDCRSHASGEFYEGLKREWGDKVMRTIIHLDDKIETCAGRRQPVQTYALTSAAATLYAELADEIMPRLGVAASLSGCSENARPRPRIVVSGWQSGSLRPRRSNVWLPG